MQVASPPTDQQLEVAARRLGAALRQRRWRLASAESCTGGLVGHVVTGVAGSSDYYAGGVISYDNRAKEVQLGVPTELIEAHGAVSVQVAAAMATGVRDRFGVDLGLSVTGVAGPGGGSDQKPVGLVYVAAARRGRPAAVHREQWSFDRDGNKRASALSVLELATREVEAEG
jgi:PncC family amidohydrolase